MFRGSEVLSALLLEWIATTQNEFQAVEQILVTIGELLKEFAQEEMEDCLNSFLQDIGILLIILSKNPQLRELLENQLITQFDALT